MTKILVIEDDAFLVKVYKLKLEQQGYQVMYLQDGYATSQHVLSFKPDLILLDILLPVRNGLRVLTELKSNPNTASIPVLILSALQMEDEIAEGIKLGAGDYLPKTDVSFDQVIAIIQKLIPHSSPTE